MRSACSGCCEVVADLVEQVVAVRICQDFGADVEVLGQLVLTLGQVQRAAHGRLEVSQTQMDQTLGARVRVAGGGEAEADATLAEGTNQVAVEQAWSAKSTGVEL